VADQGLRSEIRRLVDLDVPSAPWLEERVMVAVHEAALGRRRTGSKRQSRGLTVAAIAAALIAFLLVGVLLGSGLALRQVKNVPARATPIPNSSQHYREVVYRDWGPLQSSADTGSCYEPIPICREQTLKARNLAMAFRSDLQPLAPPSELEPFDQELRQGLDTLIAALDDRIAAIDAGDQQRLDQANVHIGQTTDDVIGRAIREMECWPKGVNIGNGLWRCNY
jgi:hypothetical protein